MNKLYAGFGRAVITPPIGTWLAGDFSVRPAEGVFDDLEANALALQVEDTKVLVISLDLCYIKRQNMDIIREAISQTTGLPMEAIYVAATHTHTGPIVDSKHEKEHLRNYFVSLKIGVLNAAHQALANLKPARMGWRVGTATEIGFNRRFRMKDGTVRSNPGYMNPDIAEPIGMVDDRVSMVRFDQEGGDSIVLAHYGMHPSTLVDLKISADWPGFVRRTVERAIPGTKCLFLTGPQGDIGAQNVWATDGMLNGQYLIPGGYWKGYGHTQHIGMVIAGAVLQVYSKANYRDVDKLSTMVRQIHIPTNRPTPEVLERAKLYMGLHKAGKDDEIPFTAMELTTVLGEASRALELENGPDYFIMELIGVSMGDVALLGIPGEPFGEIGVEIRKAPEWELILPTCCTNSYEGYFPMMECYEEGGYEARASRFKPGVAEQIIAEGTALLAELRNK